MFAGIQSAIALSHQSKKDECLEVLNGLIPKALLANKYGWVQLSPAYISMAQLNFRMLWFRNCQTQIFVHFTKNPKFTTDFWLAIYISIDHMLIAHALRPFCYLNNKYKRKLHGKISHATYHAMTVFSLSSYRTVSVLSRINWLCFEKGSIYFWKWKHIGIKIISFALYFRFRYKLFRHCTTISIT